MRASAQLPDSSVWQRFQGLRIGGEQLPLLVLRGRSKEGFAGPKAVVFAQQEAGPFLILFIPVAFHRTVYCVYAGVKKCLRLKKCSPPSCPVAAQQAPHPWDSR